MQQAGDEMGCAQLLTVLVTHVFPNHNCGVLQATVAILTQSAHSLFCGCILLNAVACALPQL